MYFVLTPEQEAAMQKANSETLIRLMEEARKKAEARRAWEESHPPCPHCGRRDQLPLWFQ